MTEQPQKPNPRKLLEAKIDTASSSTFVSIKPADSWEIKVPWDQVEFLETKIVDGDYVTSLALKRPITTPGGVHGRLFQQRVLRVPNQ